MPRLRCGCCRRRCYISFNTRDWLYCRVIKLYVGYDLRPSFLHSRRGPRARHHDIFAGRKKKKKKKKKTEGGHSTIQRSDGDGRGRCLSINIKDQREIPDGLLSAFHPFLPAAPVSPNETVVIVIALFSIPFQPSLPRSLLS